MVCSGQIWSSFSFYYSNFSIVLAVLHAELRLCPAGSYLLHAELCLCPSESYLLCTEFKVFIRQSQKELWGTFSQLWGTF